MKYDFDILPDRRHSDSVKWRYFDEDVLPLWVADMDFVSPEPVIRALHERVAHGIFGYSDNSMPHEKNPSPLEAIIIQRLEDRYGWQIQPKDIILIPGVVAGFMMAGHAQAALAAGEPAGKKGVLIQTPVYMPFLRVAETTGMSRQEMELTRQPDGTYTIDYSAFESAILPETSMFLLCNPHNPVGRVFRRDELERMAEISLRHGLTICSDEIHCDLVYSGHPHIPIASLDPEIAQHTITLIAPSKTYNIAGLSASVAIIQNESLRRRFRNAQQGLVHGVNILGWAAALAAYQDGQEWLDQLLAYLEANRDFVYETVKTELPSIHMAKPEGTYLAWLDCRQTGLGDDPCGYFLEHARVAFNDGKTFGPGGEGFVRLNFGCPRSVLVEALARMKKAMQK